MMRRTAPAMNWLDYARRARAEQQQQFSSMDGLEPGADRRFDDFVAEQRRRASFDEFDQRVERAFRTAKRLHTAEVWNGVKRRVTKGAGTKLSLDGIRDANRAVEQRVAWLRDVFAQIDADYRSGDKAREERAALEVSRALSGDPGDYMRHAYESKLQARNLGPKGKMQQEAHDVDAATLPPLEDEEVNRYAALKPSMAAVEAALVEQYGRAGTEHWAVLQREKDLEYQGKLQRAADVYHDLREQDASYAEAQDGKQFRAEVQRMHRATVKYETAMEIEEERLRMVAAHRLREKERFAETKAAIRDQLQEAATLRQQGVETRETAEFMRMRSVHKVAERAADQAAQRQADALSRRRAFVNVIDKIEDAAERREGQALLGGRPQSEGGAEAARLWEAAGSLAKERAVSDMQEAGAPDAVLDAARIAPPHAVADHRATKQALWDVINDDVKRDDPFAVVHQARLDARATFDDVYTLMRADRLRLGKKARRTTGWAEHSEETEKKVLQDPGREQLAFSWGMNHVDVFHLNDDGKTNFVTDVSGMYYRDDQTGDLDLTKTKKGGRGPIFQGARLYKMGIDAEGRRRDDSIK